MVYSINFTTIKKKLKTFSIKALRPTELLAKKIFFPNLKHSELKICHKHPKKMKIMKYHIVSYNF